MNEVGRRNHYLALADLLLMALLFSALTGSCLSQPDQLRGPDGGMGQEDPKMEEKEMLNPGAGTPLGLPVDVPYSGHGFALQNNESHVLRFKVELLLPMRPEQIRDLMASNKSLEEIRDDIRANVSAEELIHRGSLIFDRSIYDAINIFISSTPGNSTVLMADLADIDLARNESSLGKISITISQSEEGRIGRGELKINQGEHAGLYSVLLDMEGPRRGNRRGQEKGGELR